MSKKNFRLVALSAVFLISLFFVFSVFVSKQSIVNASTNNLVGYWNLDEGTGTISNDFSGNANNGTVVSGTWATTGKISGALQFNGTNTTVSLGNPSVLNPVNQITLSAWINPSNVASSLSQDIIAKEGPNNQQYAINIQTGTGGKLRFTIKSGVGNTVTNLSSVTAFSNNTWYFVTGTYDGANMKIYVNGVLEGSIAKTGIMSNNGLGLAIGNRSTGSAIPFKGMIDDVRIYDRALSAQEVSDIYTGVAPLPPPPVTDITPPVISSIFSSNLTTTSATVSWTTDENSTSKVDYGVTNSYGTSSPLNSSLVTSHSFNIAGLSPGTLYHYRVISTDGFGNTATSPDQTLNTYLSLPPVIPPPTGTNWTALPWTVNDRIRDSIVAPNGDIFVGTKTSGVFRSTDGGQTWAAANTGLVVPGDYHSFGLTKLGEVLVSIDDVTTAGNKLYKFNGTGWTLTQGATAGQWIGGTALDAFGNVIAGGVWGGPIYKSTDNANTFTQVATIGDAVFSMYADRNYNVYVGTEGQGVFKSNDSGATWVNLGRPTGGTISGGGGNIHSIFLTQAGSLLACSNSVVTKWLNGTLWSQAQGIPFTDPSNTANSCRHIYQTSDGKIYAVTDMGLYTSTDDGNNFSPTTTTGLPVVTSTFDPYSSSKIYQSANGEMYMGTEIGVYKLANVVADTTAPVINITSVPNNAYVIGSVPLIANATDNVGVTSVQFQVDGVNVSPVLTGSSPYTFNWNSGTLIAGSHTMSVIARDAANNSGTNSVNINVIVNSICNSSFVCTNY